MLCSGVITKVGDIMNGKMISIFMQASTISVLFVVLLVVFFIALIAMTIALLASRSDKSDDDYDEDEDIDEEKFDERSTSDDVKKASGKEYDKEDIGSIFAEADKAAMEDSAFTDSAFTDSAFTDSAFTDSAFTDSAFTDSVFTDSAFMDSVFTDKIESKVVDTYADDESSSSKDRHEEEYDDGYDEVGDTDELIATDEQREFIEQLKNRDVEEKADYMSDSTFADGVFTDSVFSDSVFADSAFDEQNMSAFEIPDRISNEDIDASVKEAVELGKAVSESSFSGYSQMAQPAKGAHTGRKKKTNVPITDDFYWFNKLDVQEKPDYKTKEMYYHHFNVPEDCIEELLIEMYDCALVRTEEIRYIAYGIEPRTTSMKEIMGNGNSSYNQKRLKEPNAEDLLKIYAKWCSYVDELFEKVEIHADDYTTEKIRTLLCEFGRSDVDEILEGK